MSRLLDLGDGFLVNADHIVRAKPSDQTPDAYPTVVMADGAKLEWRDLGWADFLSCWEHALLEPFGQILIIPSRPIWHQAEEGPTSAELRDWLSYKEKPDAP